MRTNWQVTEVFDENEPKFLVADTGGDLVVELYRKTLGSTWFVSCDTLSMYDYAFEAENTVVAMHKAFNVVIDRINEIISHFRNFTYELQSFEVQDGKIYGKDKMTWRKFGLRGEEGFPPESGQKVLYEVDAYSPDYGVGTFYREGDYLDDEIQCSKDNNFFENMIKGVNVASDRKAESTGFYEYRCNSETGLGEWCKVVSASDVVAWTPLVPSKLGKEEGEEHERT